MNWLSFGKRNPADSDPQATTFAEDGPVAAPNGKIILVVDDDLVIIKTTSAKLKSQGYQVITAQDAADAMSAVRQQRPDLILLDISFPPDVGVDWDGLKIMLWLQRMDEAKDIPVIVVSGSEPEKYRKRCLAAGATGFFYKPARYEELLPFIAEVLQTKDRQAVCHDV